MISQHKPSILALLEPHMSGTHADKVCCKSGFDNWIIIEAVGFSGEIWLFWKQIVDIESIVTHPQFVLFLVNHDTVKWYLSVVYDSLNAQLKRKLWEELDHAILKIDGPWISLGDFNVVSGRDEVSEGGDISHYQCERFNDWIFLQGLF